MIFVKGEHVKEIYEWLYDEYAEAASAGAALRSHVLEEVSAAPEDIRLGLAPGGGPASPMVYRRPLPEGVEVYNDSFRRFCLTFQLVDI